MFLSKLSKFHMSLFYLQNMDMTCPSFHEDSDYGSHENSKEEKIGGLCHLRYRQGTYQVLINIGY